MTEKTLMKKLVEVMSSIESVKKDGFNAHFKYKYVSEAAILDAVKEELVKRNIFLFTSVEDSTRDGNITIVKTLHTFVDADSGEQYSVKGLGHGQDQSDKGSGKAIVNSFKYFLLKNMMISTNDDPESTEQTPAKKPDVPKQSPKTDFKPVNKAPEAPKPIPTTPVPEKTEPVKTPVSTPKPIPSFKPTTTPTVKFAPAKPVEPKEQEPDSEPDEPSF
jgi:hypothetical protein